MKKFLSKNWLWILGIGILLIGYETTEIFEQNELFSRILTPEISPFSIAVLLALATLVSEDLTCLTAGTLVSQGKLGLALAVFACGFGIFIGDILIYGTGRFFGRKALETKIFRNRFSEVSLRKGAIWLEKYGKSAVFISRFTFGLRLPIYFIAGTLKTDFLKFAFYFLLAVSLWTPLIVGSTALLGSEILKSTVFQKNFQLGFTFTIVAFYLLLRAIFKLQDKKNRRLLIGRIERITRWEFWSIKVFYIPVIIHIVRLAIKYKSLTVFTCTNPGIFAGGFVGESKNEIYRNLKKSLAAGKHLLSHVLLKKEFSLPKKIAVIWQFIDENQLNFPLVLKPDSGERGKDVKIIRSFIKLKKEIENAEKDFILQEFAEGFETSVFYYRFPDEANGKIFSITEKRFPELIGDGNSTVEELILNDKRAVCLAKIYFERNRDILDKIPARNEIVQIVNIGTHSQGAIFLDGNYLKTVELEKKIDAICRDFKGFYFGRFDLRTKSLEDFQRGENFKIIELNGVTSESTDIYDPRNSLFKAYKILFKQWRIAFEIGAKNKEKGCEPLSWFELAKLVYENLYGKKTKRFPRFREFSEQPNS